MEVKVSISKMFLTLVELALVYTWFFESVFVSLDGLPQYPLRVLDSCK